LLAPANSSAILLRGVLFPKMFGFSFHAAFKIYPGDALLSFPALAPKQIYFLIFNTFDTPRKKIVKSDNKKGQNEKLP
jgi:hypothetical protein